MSFVPSKSDPLPPPSSPSSPPPHPTNTGAGPLFCWNYPNHQERTVWTSEIEEIVTSLTLPLVRPTCPLPSCLRSFSVRGREGCEQAFTIWASRWWRGPWMKPLKLYHCTAPFPFLATPQTQAPVPRTGHFGRDGDLLWPEEKRLCCHLFPLLPTLVLPLHSPSPPPIQWNTLKWFFQIRFSAWSPFVRPLTSLF